MAERFDAIIVGGSFAGLSVAYRLRGKVLMVTKHPPGAFQTSACCTYLPVLERLGCEDSILQTIDTFVVHFPGRRITFRLRTPFCTFDYRRFCQALADRLCAEVLIASAQSYDGGILTTTAGKFRTACLIDCSGWEASLARRRAPGLVRKDWLSFGIETETEWQDEAMHFYFDQEVVEKGVAWVFPCGSYSRIGVASYQGQTSLKSCLVRFLEKLRAPLREIHGGYFPHALRPPVVDGLFLVGDSAGQCIPLTGEGIRTSIYFGLLCGEIVQGVIGGLHSLEYGLRAYAQEVRRYRRFFRVFFLAQQAFVRAPESLAAAAFAFISRDYCMNYIQDRYEVLSNLRLPGKGVSMVAGDSLRHGRQEVAEDLGEEG